MFIELLYVINEMGEWGTFIAQADKFFSFGVEQSKSFTGTYPDISCIVFEYTLYVVAWQSFFRLSGRR